MALPPNHHPFASPPLATLLPLRPPPPIFLLYPPHHPPSHPAVCLNTAHHHGAGRGEGAVHAPPLPLPKGRGGGRRHVHPRQRHWRSQARAGTFSSRAAAVRERGGGCKRVTGGGGGGGGVVTERRWQRAGERGEVGRRRGYGVDAPGLASPFIRAANWRAVAPVEAAAWGFGATARGHRGTSMVCGGRGGGPALTRARARWGVPPR